MYSKKGCQILVPDKTEVLFCRNNEDILSVEMLCPEIHTLPWAHQDDRAVSPEVVMQPGVRFFSTTYGGRARV